MGSSSSSLTSSCDDRTKEAVEFILHQIVPEYGKIFEEVSDSEVRPGDVMLFPKDSSGGSLSFIFKHAAVCCGDEEVIHLTTNSKNIVRISKEGFNSMKRKSGKCRIFRKKGMIDFDDFNRKVKMAMNCEATYDLGKNNCVHFALFLLGLAKFYMDPVKTCNEGRKKKQRCIVM